MGAFFSFNQFLKSCFAAGTPILTPDGFKPIEELRDGDLVLSAPEDDATVWPAPRRVEEVFQAVSSVFVVRVGGRDIRTTAEHPFYVQGKGWVKAFELSAGDLLRTAADCWLPVESVADAGELVTVYNCRVAEYHTYFVGGEHWGFAVWAHNADCNVINGNSALSPRTATLYKLVDNAGKFLKWGITQNVLKRYPKAFMEDKRMIRMTQGSRSLMLLAERWLIQTQRGPMNLERINPFIRGMR